MKMRVIFHIDICLPSERVGIIGVGGFAVNRGKQTTLSHTRDQFFDNIPN